MNLQVKSSLLTLLIAVVSIYFFSSLKAEAKQVSEQINEKIVELEKSSLEIQKRLDKFPIEEMEKKVEELEKSLDDIRNILGTSKKDSI